MCSSHARTKYPKSGHFAAIPGVPLGDVREIFAYFRLELGPLVQKFFFMLG
jgi:hypothetical protein